MAKTLSETGISYLWGKIKENFSSISHKHSASDITSGTLPVERGGTGATTASDARTNLGVASSVHNHSTNDITNGTLPAERGGTGNATLKDSMNALVNSLGTGTDAPQDDDYFISQYVGGGDTTTTYHRRKFKYLWNYIKSKADSLYSALGHTHNLGSSFKITEVAVTTNSISAHSYQSGASISMTAQLGYTAIGIVGWKSNSYKIRPTSHYIEGNTSLFSGFANTSASSATSAKVTFKVLWAKNTI